MRYRYHTRILAAILVIVGLCAFAPVASAAEEGVPADGITVSETEACLCIGDELTLFASVSPANATDPAYTWASSNADVAAIEDGVVTALSAGSAQITATSADGGYTDSCTIEVVPETLASAKYEIDGGVLRYVSSATSPAQLLANMENGADHLAVLLAGASYTGLFVGTGMTVRLTVNSQVRDEAAIIALGDANGDGLISITDYTLTRLDILGLTELAGLFGEAADVDENGQISITDYTMLRLHILGIKRIGAGDEDPPAEDPRRQMLIDFALTQLGKPYVLGGKGPDYFDCSGFVYYCLNSIGFEIRYMTSTTWQSANYMTITDMHAIEKGDILCFNGHVGIYMGDGGMVDASSSNGMIVTRSNIFGSTYWTENFVCAKRVFD